VAARWAPKAPLQSRRAEKSASDMVNASRQRSCNNIVRRFRAITFLFSDERRHRVLSVWRNSLPTDFLKNNWWTVFMASIDHRRFTDGSLYDYWPTAKDRSTLATMSKQQATLLPVASTLLLVWTGLTDWHDRMGTILIRCRRRNARRSLLVENLLTAA